MVKISDLLPITSSIRISDTQSLEVRALSFEEITRLVWVYKDVVVSMFGESQNLKDVSYERFLMAAPELCADIIAMGADAIGQQDDIKRLPGTVQLIALTEIWRLSVPDPKKLLESLTKILGELRELSKNKGGDVVELEKRSTL